VETKQLTPNLGRKEASKQVKDLVESLIAIADTEHLEKLVVCQLINEKLISYD
jgi:hypothetical protein